MGKNHNIFLIGHNICFLLYAKKIALLKCPKFTHRRKWELPGEFKQTNTATFNFCIYSGEKKQNIQRLIDQWNLLGSTDLQGIINNLVSLTYQQLSCISRNKSSENIAKMCEWQRGVRVGNVLQIPPHSAFTNKPTWAFKLLYRSDSHGFCGELCRADAVTYFCKTGFQRTFDDKGPPCRLFLKEFVTSLLACPIFQVLIFLQYHAVVNFD